MSNYKLIAESLIILKQPQVYKEVEKGFFKNTPELEGYLVNLSKIFKAQSFFIFNISGSFDKENSVKSINNKIFITYSIKDFESIEIFINNLESYAKDIIRLLEKAVEESNKIKKINSNEIKSDKSSKYGLPYGYSKDSEGNVVVDKEEANLALKVFKTYIKIRSIRKTTQLLANIGMKSRQGNRIDNSVISGILHNKDYLEMSIQIIPTSLFYNAQKILGRNSKDDNLIKRI